MIFIWRQKEEPLTLCVPRKVEFGRFPLTKKFDVNFHPIIHIRLGLLATEYQRGQLHESGQHTYQTMEEDAVEAALEQYRKRPLGGTVLHNLRQKQQQQRNALNNRGDRSPDAPTSKDSLITMPPTTASLKTHTGHGHKEKSQAHTGGRTRHHSGGYHRRSSTRVNHDMSPGITTPTPVQQSSEVRKLKNTLQIYEQMADHPCNSYISLPAHSVMAYPSNSCWDASSLSR